MCALEVHPPAGPVLAACIIQHNSIQSYFQQHKSTRALNYSVKRIEWNSRSKRGAGH